MSLRLPLTTVLDVQNNGLIGAASVNGGIANTFTIPQDTDNIVVKFSASTVGGGVSTTLQTTDDGGTTWYDMATTSVVSNANGTTPEWISRPVMSTGLPVLGIKGRTFTVVGVGVGAVNSVRTQVLVNSQSATA